MHVPGGDVPTSYGEQKLQEEVRAATGSNAWAIAGSKTRSGKPMLLINPHQPYYGFGQFYEAHLRSGEGWNFTGASFFGTPSPALGHNEYCGWGFTTNEPNVGSSWRETFDDPDEPLNYRYGDGYRKADEWNDTIKVKRGGGDFETIDVTFRKTHHGPILHKTERQGIRLGQYRQALRRRSSRGRRMQMVRAKNIDDFRAAMGMLELHCSTRCTPTSTATSFTSTTASCRSATRRSIGTSRSTAAIRAPSGRASIPSTICRRC